MVRVLWLCAWKRLREMRQADNSSKNLRETLLITFIGGAMDFLLAIAKVAYGILTGFDAILADGIHSLSDFVSDAILYIFVKFSYQPRDRKRPYGNRKIESLAALIIAVILALTVAGMIWTHVQSPEVDSSIPVGLSISIMAANIVIKEGLFWYTYLAAKRLRSPALIANAWHHRSDSFSSLAVLLCLVMSAIFGNAPLWDHLGVAMVSIMILKAVWEIGRGALTELLDRAPDKEIVDRIEEIADGHPEVVFLHDLRVRTVGGSHMVSLTVEIHGHRSVREACRVMDQIRKDIREKLENVLDVLIQVAPAGAFAAQVQDMGLEKVNDEDLL